MRYALGFSLLVSVLILGTFLVPNSVYAQNSVQDPADINLSLGDLTGYTWLGEKRYDGPSEIAQELHLSEALWTNWQFEIGSVRFFDKSDGFIKSDVYRFSSSRGAKLELDYREAHAVIRIPMFEFDRIGDEGFAARAPEQVHAGVFFYFVKFRKGQFTVELLTNSFDVAKESAKIIESKIEAPLGQGDLLSTLIAFGGAGAILSTTAYIIIKRRGQAKFAQAGISLLPVKRKKM